MDFWADVERISLSLKTISYFELLEVDAELVMSGKNPTALTDAYHRALRRYHPDRYAVGSSVRQKEALARICARVGEAYRALSTPRGRADYVASRESGIRAAPKKTRTPLTDSRDPKGEKARSLLESARMLANSGNVAGARAKLDLALQFEPDSMALRSAKDALTSSPPSSDESL